MMLVMNALARYSPSSPVHQEELQPALDYAYAHSEFLFHLLLFIIFSTLGQLLILYGQELWRCGVQYYHVGAHPAFNLDLMLRVLHPITELGFVGVILVFGSIAYRIGEDRGQSLIRWKKEPMKTVEARKIFSEWHEHLDDC